MNKITKTSWRSNLRIAMATWGDLGPFLRKSLKQVTREYSLSVAAGDLLLLAGKWYVTHSGLIRLAERRRCSGISTSIQHALSNPEIHRWIFKATVYKTRGAKGFVGYGDADPSNVSPMVRGAEIRIAETRAVNRALRKAYGIGLCSVEELGAFSNSSKTTSTPSPSRSSNGNGSHNGQPRLRDRLCLLIRQYNLDPNLVKAYAADFCGTETLSGASRDLVESFINQLEKSAKENRDSLLCKLNSYAPVSEVTR